jgi:opine dehydrogenase
MASLTVFGGGNTAFAVAANLTLAGHQVTLCELPAFASMVDPIRDSQQINLDGVAGRGVATLHRVTTSFSEAMGNELLLVIVPAYAHKAFAEAIEPHLRPNHDIVLMPGTLGSLEFARIFRDKDEAPEGVVIAEADTAPYVCRKMSPTSATIWGVVSGLGVGVFPATETERVRKRLDPLFPGIVAHPHVAACGLAAMNPVVHPAGVLLNAGRIEQSRGEFFFYDEGVTPAVCRLIYGVDAERRALGQVLGIDLLPVDAAFHRAGFGPKGDLWAAINGSRMLTQLKAPGSLETRWLSEDVPYGIASWALLGEQFGLRMPLMRALVDLTSATVGIDFWKAARTPKELGIAAMSCDALLKYVQSGAL